MNATDICSNCGCEFAEHNYVPDSINKYKCLHPQQECGYGFFPGGDPRNFLPDGECCSEKEIEAHKKACEFWDNATEEPKSMKNSSGWVHDKEGNAVAHFCGSPFGVGTYSIEWESFFEIDERKDGEL